MHPLVLSSLIEHVCKTEHIKFSSKYFSYMIVLPLRIPKIFREIVMVQSTCPPLQFEMRKTQSSLTAKTVQYSYI